MIACCPIFRGEPLFSEPAVTEAARRHGRTPAQIVLRWHMQKGSVVPIPRTTRKERLAENLAVSGFALSEEEMAAISGLSSRGQRLCDFGFSPQWDKL